MIIEIPNWLCTSLLTWLLQITSTCFLISLIHSNQLKTTTYEQPFPINLSIPDFDSSLLHASTNLKNFVQDYTKNKEIFDLEERHVFTIKSLNHSNKNFFSNNYIVDIFMFATSVISLISTTLILYLSCKHKQIGILMTGLILHKIKNVEASSSETNSECKTLAYIGIVLTILSLIIVTFLL